MAQAGTNEQKVFCRTEHFHTHTMTQLTRGRLAKTKGNQDEETSALHTWRDWKSSGDVESVGQGLMG